LALGELAVGEDDGARNAAQNAGDDEHVLAAFSAFGIEPGAEPDVGRGPARDEAVFHLWPEHVPAVELWAVVQTQWRHGFDGPTGLDYAGVRVALDMRARRQDIPRRFRELQVMEHAALAAWAERRAQRASRTSVARRSPGPSARPVRRG
jgi:hypothetical protein